MVLERNDTLIGIDCGASKVLLQSAKINPSRTIISKGSYCKEYVYSSHPDWDPSYQPIPIDVQIKENNGIYSFRYFNIETKKTCCIKSDRLDKVECLHRDIKQKHAKSDELLESKTSALNQPLKELKWQFIKQLIGSLKVSARTKMHHFVTYTTLIHWAIKHCVYAQCAS